LPGALDRDIRERMHPHAHRAVLHAPVVVTSLALALFAACWPRAEHQPAAGAAAKAPATTGELPLVTVEAHEAQQQVEVLFDGRPFTTYRFAADLKKPLLLPIRSEGQGIITRGWPVEPRDGEATDHPHHIGFWFNYGDVAGVDFWGNSTALSPEALSSKGSVVHRTIRSARGGRGRGELEVSSDWVGPAGATAVQEETRYVFAGSPGRRAIDRIALLTAPTGPVKMPDNKEGALGLRLARALEHPSSKNPTGTGRYHSSEGIEGEAVWGTRGRWMMLTGTLEGEAGGPVTLAILDHPGNPGYPTYWHARPWGLFSANPLGQSALSKGKDTLSFVLPAGPPTRFAYRLLILTGHAKPAQIEAEHRRFIDELK
jgi:hypothetical protein